MARKLSAAHKKAISMALRRVKGKTTGLDEYVPKPKAPKKPAAPKKTTRASAGSGKKTAVKKTAGKKPAPAKAPAKKTAAKKPAAKAPARKNVLPAPDNSPMPKKKTAARNNMPPKAKPRKNTLPAPDNSPMPKKKTAATNRPTPKAETPAQARKADAEFKANREARRNSTPFGSIRNSMAEAQLINGRGSNRDRDEDLAEAIQRDSKLTGAEATAKRNAGTSAQLNAAKRRKAALREKEQAKAVTLNDRTEEMSAALDDLVARPDMSAERRSMAAVELANDAARLATEADATPGTASKANSLADRAAELAMRMAESAAANEVTGERAAAVLDAAKKAGGAGRREKAAKKRVDDLVKQNVPESDKRLAKARTELRRLRESGSAPDPRVSGFNADGLW